MFELKIEKILNEQELLKHNKAVDIVIYKGDNFLEADHIYKNAVAFMINGNKIKIPNTDLEFDIIEIDSKYDPFSENIDVIASGIICKKKY